MSQLPPGYSLHIGYPPVEEYLNLRALAGHLPRPAAQANAVSTGSWYGCYIRFSPLSRSSDNTNNENPLEEEQSQASEIVGMGRIIGDGGWYFVIADMAVLPTHQRKGLGDCIIKHLIQKIRSTPPMCLVTSAEGGPKPYVNLLADEPGRKLYEKNGFKYTAPRSLGMVLEW